MLSCLNLATCKKLGFIVPSSNTAVEPITEAIVRSTGENIICIFTRIQVRTLGTDTGSTSQFSTKIMTHAASLLTDAEAHTVVWNGTSGQWTGGSLEDDRTLAVAMENVVGSPCSTTTIATVEALRHLKAKKISIAVPYAEVHTAKVAEFFHKCGYDVLASKRLEVTPSGNCRIAESSEEDIKRVVRQCAVPGCEAIIVSCTNWPGTGLVDVLEKELDVTIIDSISVTAWWALRLVGFEKAIPGWGRLLEME